jgi:hypothetical protein
MGNIADEMMLGGPRQRETFDGHAFKNNRQEECVQLPSKMAISAPQPPFRQPRASVAIRTSRLASREAGKSANIHTSLGVIWGGKNMPTTVSRWRKNL